MSLTLNDLPLVFEELHDARKRWYEIGLQLSIPVQDLESILSENKNDQNICLRRVLMTWLKSGKAKWSTMCSVLTNRTIGEKVLAEELRKKYHTNQSTLPSQGEKAQTTNPTSTQERQSVLSTNSQLDQQTPSGNPNVSTCLSTTDLPKTLQESQSVQDKKSHKRKSETPVPSAAKKTKLEIEVKLPDSLSIEIFARRPSPDHYCMKCVPSKVPLNPHRTECCQKLYCEHCSKKTKKCTNRKHHNQELRFTIDKDMKDQVAKLKLKSCCNLGCNWPGGEVYKLKNHLPQCDYATKRGIYRKQHFGTKIRPRESAWMDCFEVGFAWLALTKEWLSMMSK